MVESLKESSRVARPSLDTRDCTVIGPKIGQRNRKSCAQSHDLRYLVVVRDYKGGPAAQQYRSDFLARGRITNMKVRMAMSQ